MNQQPDIRLRNDFQTLMRIENGAVSFSQPEDLNLKPSYRAITVNDQLAFMRSRKTGITLMEDPVLMAVVQSVLALQV
jgi:hypothetical protein